MKVNRILNNSLNVVTQKMHVTRKKALFSCVESLLKGSHASVTAIGRDISSPAYEKHRIKRADRLLSNTHLNADAISIYKSLAEFLISPKSKPIILVDWSNLDDHSGNFLIRASIVTEARRGLTIYEEVHGVGTKEKPSSHAIFLKNLHHVIGNDCKPIIVTDAGFRVPWFKQVLKLGWDFVGRSRRPNSYSLNKENWFSFKELYAHASKKPKTLSGYITKSNPLAVNMVLYREKSKGRKDLNNSDEPRQSNKSRKYALGSSDPWVISTSLRIKRGLGKKIVDIYKTRMQIEEGFRDMKSPRFGQGMGFHKSKKTKRLANLVLLTTLANWVNYLCGTIAIMTNQHRRYQANSSKKRRVLSIVFIGRRVLKDSSFKILKRHLTDALKYVPKSLDKLMEELL
jgi:hypothetical protein